jgi:predicted dehydrogenase
MLNIAIAGCGYWGPNLIRNLRTTPGCKVWGVCDLDPTRLQHMLNLYPDIRVTTDFQEVVNNPEIDGIAIATPVSKHFPMALKALESGKHIFIEKPMASSTEECEILIDTAESRGLTLMVGHTFLYTPVVQKIKQIIDAGDLGEVLYISARRLNLGLFQKDINVAWDLAPHDISIILYLLGEEPVAVNCQGKAHLHPGIEDVTNASLTFRNGKFATIQSSWLDPNKVREMTIVGSRRMCVYNDLEPMEKIKIYDKRAETPPHYDTFAEFHYSYHYGDTYAPYLRQEEPLKVECSHFIECIQNGTRPITSGYEGMKVVQILEAISESLHSNGNQIQIRPGVREIRPIARLVAN